MSQMLSCHYLTIYSERVVMMGILSPPLKYWLIAPSSIRRFRTHTISSETLFDLWGQWTTYRFVWAINSLTRLYSERNDDSDMKNEFVEKCLSLVFSFVREAKGSEAFTNLISSIKKRGKVCLLDIFDVLKVHIRCRYPISQFRIFSLTTSTAWH